jgi:molybdenum cofactor cytidylyltransferase
MKFGAVSTHAACGAILAHSVKVSGRTLKKGRVLDTEDIASLLAAQIATITVAQLDANDVPENAAAEGVARAICGNHLHASAAFTGRVNLYAAAAGLALIDAERLQELNGVDESLTVATLAPFSMVQKNQMVATIKIIPYAVPRAAFDRALSIAERGPLISCAAFRQFSAALIATRFATTKDNVLRKGADVIAQRVQRLHGTLGNIAIVNHEIAPIAAALRAALVQHHSPLLISGTIATVDRNDIVPAALLAAGGEVLHYGMPVDPGNLLLLGRIGDTPVIGLPSCARSPKLNGFDFVLERIAAGLPAGRAQLIALGCGGLLNEIPSRPMPRDSQPSGTFAPQLAAIVLAAGSSTRMGADNKLLRNVRGKPLVTHAIDAALDASLSPVIVVTGFQAEQVVAALAQRAVKRIHNVEFATGLSSSLRAGLNALDETVAGAVILLADMPAISADHLRKLAAAFSPDDGRAIVIPTHQGRWGNPLLWARRFFDEISQLSGDRGARQLAEANEELVTEVPLDESILIDIDQPKDFIRYQESS